MKLKKKIIKFLSCFIFLSKYRRAFREKYLGGNSVPTLSKYQMDQARYNIGEFSYIGYNSIIKNEKETTVGKYCSISHEVCIGLSQHPLNCLTTHGFIAQEKCSNIDNLLTVPKENVVDFSKECMPPIKIGNDVWIGYRAMIMDGITIEDGAVIAAGAVVTKNVPAYEIWGGVPAKPIGKRFSNIAERETICEKLLELKWWDYPCEFVEKLPFANIEKCIEILEENKHLRQEAK